MLDLFAVKHAYLIPLLPLLGAMLAGFLGARFLKQQSHWPIWIGVGASALLSLSLLFGMLGVWNKSEGHEPALSQSVKWFDWITAGGNKTDFTSYRSDAGLDVRSADGTVNPLKTFYVQAGTWIDPLTAIMLCVVCGIGFFITVFAAGYMTGESGYFRFFAYLGLFLFSMTVLVMGNNFVMLYLGWEGVGLCSYLLIGYYYERPAAREAAKKAFLVNRIGDFGFALGIMLIYLAFGTVSYYGNGAHTFTGVLEMATAGPAGMTSFQQHAMQWIPFLLMLGAFGKSAQFPLYVWLPDAMEGPTPVSALIHAATMVTAGIYMIARCGTLFVTNEPALITIAFVGAFTALFAGSIALRQFDLKKVFAYSTVSQLGFMFAGMGVLAPVAGVFHLITHAFFKALLFLSSGVVMHAMAGELDMRKFSGLKRVLPKTNILMLIGCLALSGFPFFSGFFSKDDIVHAAFHHSFVLGSVLLFTAFLTAYYTFRLYFRVFQGPEILPEAPAHGHGHGTHDPHAHAAASESAIHTNTAETSGVDEAAAHHPPAHHADDQGHGHEGHHNHEPWLMMLPLFVLAIGAVLAGYLNWPEREHNLGAFLGQSPSISQSYLVAANRFDSLDSHKTEFNVEEAPFGQEAMDPYGHTIKPALFNPVMGISAIVAILGIWLAYQFHLKDRPAAERLARRFSGLTGMLEGKYWIDEIYQNAVVEPLKKLGRAFFVIDQMVVDGIVWLVGFVPQASGFALKLTTQRGYLQGYAATMLFGVAVILLVIFW
jgi:NADH-quinone oxidoreductase subunit L